MSRRLRFPWADRFLWAARSLWADRSLWAAHFWWWQLPAALVVIAAQQGLRRVGWMRLGDTAATAGRFVWFLLVVGWPLLVATGIIVWQRRRRARANLQLRPADDQEAPRQRPERPRRVLLSLTAAAAGVLVLLTVLVVLPVLLVPAGAIDDDKELYKARNDVRGTLVQVLAGGLVATGLVFTARTLDLNRSGQVTERFTRAVEQLGQREPGKLDVRLGGIYALERIARDSATDLPTVVEVLCAHVREYSPWPPRLPGQGRANLEPYELGNLPDLQTRAPDIQAVLTVLSRLPDTQPRRSRHTRAAANPVPRDLTDTDLRRAELSGAHLQAADLGGAHLEMANLQRAHLGGANLQRANLTNAYLTEAHLTEAHLEGADLEGARLVDAHLEKAKLDGAHLKRANLREAHLEGASLREAHLEGTSLPEAHLEGADLTRAHLEEAHLSEAHLEDAYLVGAHLEDAYLVGAHLQGAHLGSARLWGAHLGGADLRWAYPQVADLRGAMANTETVWPYGFDWRAVGVREEEDKWLYRSYAGRPGRPATRPRRPRSR
jgi:uncharacterized protein YjbI with pentapeptide repeats